MVATRLTPYLLQIAGLIYAVTALLTIRSRDRVFRMHRFYGSIRAMLAAVKIVHFLSFAIGIGAGVANAIIGMRAAGLDAALQMPLRAVQKTLGRISFATVILLWLTGIYLVYAAHGGWAGPGTVFWLKIAAVVLLTAASLTMQYLMLTAARRDPAALAQRMPQLGMVATGSAIVALAFAVIAFG